MSLKGIDDVHSSDGLSSGVLSVCDGISDDILEEDLEDTAGLLVDFAADALDTGPARETADGGPGDALDVVPKYLAVALGTALAQTFAAFSSSRHVVCNV